MPYGYVMFFGGFFDAEVDSVGHSEVPLQGPDVHRGL